MNIDQGLDFTLEHFNEPKFPRTISTKKTENKQVLVNSREEALQFFRDSDLLDCRISAFSKHEVDEVIPNLIFIDLDDVNALSETLFIFGRELRAKPLVISTGNGYAIIQPIQMESWKNTQRYDKNGEELAKLFLQFSARYLSNNKSDSGNHPSLKSCMIRIPASINSKNNAEVEIQTFWDGRRADVHSLRFPQFVDELMEKEAQIRHRMGEFTGEIRYIENLLHRKIKDGRKRVCSLVILPYLINVKKLPIDLIIKGVYDYFDGHISKQSIRYEAKRVAKMGILPYGLNKMKINDRELYSIVTGAENYK